MALGRYFNSLMAGFIGGTAALYVVPDMVNDFKKGFNEAQARKRNKPWTESQPRNDGPGTYTVYALPGAMTFLAYRNLAGKLDRDDLPAVTVFRGDGRTVMGQGWFKDGVPHREDGPAVLSFDDKGKVECEEWYLHGERMDPWQHVAFGHEPPTKSSPCEIPTETGPAPQPL